MERSTRYKLRETKNLTHPHRKASLPAISLINGTHHIPNSLDGTELVYDTAENVMATIVTDGIFRIGMHFKIAIQQSSPAKLSPKITKPSFLEIL